MSQAIAVQIKPGNTDPSIVYATIKNGNVYRFNHRLANPAAFAQRVAEAGNRIKLKHWELVRRNDKKAVAAPTTTHCIAGKCDGSGYIPKFLHIDNGKCWGCNKTGSK